MTDKKTSEISHKDLVDIAFKWAKNRHLVVLKERVAGWGEIPDVLAINISNSTLIECKVSRSDFHADKHKISRLRAEDCMGNYRIYCCPKGLLKEEELPEGWGLLEVYPSGHARLKTNVYSWKFREKYFHPMGLHGYKGERHALVSAIRDNRAGIGENKILLNVMPNP